MQGGALSTTNYNYGVTRGGAGWITTNDLLASTTIPSIASRQPVKDGFSYNALGETVQTSNGLTGNDELTHVYTFDVLGRTIADHAKAIPDGHDTTVTKITTSFDTYGRPEHFVSWGGSNGGTVINAVQREYNGFGQVTKEYQSHNGAVDTTPGSGSPFVEYGYTTAATGSLLSTVTYPKITGDWASSPRTVTLNYDSGLDAAIGRVSSISDTAPGSSAAKVEEYEYLGLGAIVERNLPEPAVVQLLHDEHDDGNKISDGGDQYTGLDRFGRVIDVAWYDTPSGGGSGGSGAFVERFQYAYDGNSNRLYKNNLLYPHLSELYHAPGSTADAVGGAFDGFDRLTHFSRGTLETINGAIRPNAIDLSNGDPYSQEWTLDEQGTWDIFNDGRSVHYDENDAPGVVPSITYAKADGNGVGTTSITPARVGRTFTHDAWNRLTESKANAPGLVLRDVDYAYDALGRMITHQSGSTTNDLYHSTAWQTLTEVDTNAQSQVTEVRDNVWSLAYVDAMVFQEKRDAATSGGERTYPLHDANYNVTALLREVDDGEGGTEWQVTSRYVYDPYGTPTKLTPGAEVDTSDSAWNYLHQGGYLTDADRLYHFRNRSYDPSNGQWLERDPGGYVDGLNLHEYVEGNPVSEVDPMGLQGGRSRRGKMRRGPDTSHHTWAVTGFFAAAWGNTMKVWRFVAQAKDGFSRAGGEATAVTGFSVGLVDERELRQTALFRRLVDDVQAGMTDEQILDALVLDYLVVGPYEAGQAVRLEIELAIESGDTDRLFELGAQGAVTALAAAGPLKLGGRSGLVRSVPSRISQSMSNSIARDIAPGVNPWTTASKGYVPRSVANRNLTQADWKALARQRRIDAKGGLPQTYREFQAFTQGRYTGVGHQAARGRAWAGFKRAHGIEHATRSTAQKTAFLRGLQQSGNAPKWMNQWLSKGRVPPGHQVDHIKPLSVGGADTPANMRLLEKWFHDLHHSPGFYRPWE